MVLSLRRPFNKQSHVTWLPGMGRRNKAFIRSWCRVSPRHMLNVKRMKLWIHLSVNPVSSLCFSVSLWPQSSVFMPVFFTLQPSHPLSVSFPPPYSYSGRISEFQDTCSQLPVDPTGDRQFISRLFALLSLIRSESLDALVGLSLGTIVNPFTASYSTCILQPRRRDGGVCVCVCVCVTVHVAPGGLAESAKQDTMCLSRGDRWRRRRGKECVVCDGQYTHTHTHTHAYAYAYAHTGSDFKRLSDR